MTSPSTYAETFAQLLTEKFKGESESTPKVFKVEPGRKYDRITQETTDGHHKSVHAFVIRETGQVLKAAGYPAPARGVRFETVEAAAANATWSGGYLYMQ